MADINIDNDQLTEDVEKLKLAIKVLDVKHKWFEDAEEFEDEDDFEQITTAPMQVPNVPLVSNIIEDKDKTYTECVPLLPLSSCTDQVPASVSVEINSNASSAEICLDLNLRYQDWININLRKVMLMLDHNRDCQSKKQAKDEEDMKNEKILEHSKKKINSLRPYFKDSEGSFPNQNCDTIDRNKRGIIDAYTKQEKLWTSLEKEALKGGVRKEIFNLITNPLLQKIDLAKEKLGQVEMGSEDEQKWSKNINDICAEIETLRNSTELNLVYGNLDQINNIDWMKISIKDMKGDRPAENCRLIWKNAVHPIINNAKWTREEDLKLLQLAQQPYNWENIAKSLDTNRSAFICLQRYQTKLNPCLQTGKWSKAEDYCLDEFVNMYKKNNYIPWTKISYYIDGRSEEQCVKRWYQLHPQTYKRGKWTVSEDKKLKKAVMMFGSNWAMIKNYVPGRNSTQCRERYSNTLNNNIQFGNWSYEDDRFIWISVKTFGEGHWAYLSNFLPHRTDNMILQRYRRLCRGAINQPPDTYNYSEHPMNLSDLKNLDNLSISDLINLDIQKGIFVPKIKYWNFKSKIRDTIEESIIFVKPTIKSTLDRIIQSMDDELKIKLPTVFINHLYDLKNTKDMIFFIQMFLNEVSKKSHSSDKSKNEVSDAVETMVSTQYVSEKINKDVYLDWQIAKELTKINSKIIKDESTLQNMLITDNEKKIIQMISGALKFNPKLSNRPKRSSINLSIASLALRNNEIKTNCKQVENTYNNLTKNITHRFVGGRASTAYSMLPLPPNTGTVAALQTIYDMRYQLSANAGEYGIVCTQAFNKKEDADLKLSFTSYKNHGVSKYLSELHDYQIIKSRFISLFLWPAILATLPNSENLNMDQGSHSPINELVNDNDNVKDFDGEMLIEIDNIKNNNSNINDSHDNELEENIMNSNSKMNDSHDNELEEKVQHIITNENSEINESSEIILNSPLQRKELLNMSTNDILCENILLMCDIYQDDAKENRKLIKAIQVLLNLLKQDAECDEWTHPKLKDELASQTSLLSSQNLSYRRSERIMDRSFKRRRLEYYYDSSSDDSLDSIILEDPDFSNEPFVNKKNTYPENDKNINNVIDCLNETKPHTTNMQWDISSLKRKPGRPRKRPF